MEHLRQQLRKAEVPRIGNLASLRPDGVWRWMYCQVNSFSVGATRDAKLRKVAQLIEQHEVDGVVFCEAGVNWSVGPSSRDLKSFFDPYMEREIRTTGSHNTHGPKVSPLQQGGTAMLLTHSLLQYAQSHTVDMRCLGRWSSWSFYRNPLHRTRIIVAYSPGQFRKGPKTVYQQQMAYINSHQLTCTPLQLFLSDLVKQLSTWKAAGDRLILFIDANESIVRGPICRTLGSIGMFEVTHKYWESGVEPNTHISGSMAIDGIFVTHDIETTNFLSLSFDESVGDHRTMILEVSTASTIGHYQGNIVRPSARRLTTKQPRVLAAYTSRLEQQYQVHRISERLNGLLCRATGTDETIAADTDLSHAIQSIYSEMDQYRINAESCCRKIAKPTLSYSPSISFWYDQIHSYRVLIRIKSGNAGSGTDVSRAIRTAHRKQIPDPRRLTIQQCWDGIAAAQAHQRQTLAVTAAGERKTYQKTQALLAHERGDSATENAIHQRMRQEHDKNIWKRIKRVTSTSTGRTCMEVQVRERDKITTFTTKQDIERAIQSEVKERFALGNSAPISRTLLGTDLRYLNNADVAFSIINGSFTIPDELDDATKLILREIGIMGSKILEGNFLPTLEITAADYVHYHKRIRESTSSSPSGLHLGHGKAAAFSVTLAQVHATQMNLIIRSGIHPTRWGTALQVLLEKVAGVCMVEKLRSIQLYEADLNWFMKFIFNDGALTALKSINYLPEEHYSQKGSTAEDACFDKTLTFDISRQTRTPMAIMSVDAAQCYDRVHHSLMSLTWLALIQNLPVVQILLSCLGDMKIYTRTGYGDSNTYFGGHSETPACGLGQGSKAAPASWVQLSSIFVRILRQKGFGANLEDPVTKQLIQSIGCLFVDDTDLYVLEYNLQSAINVYHTAQGAITLWSHLLAATGGTIKTEKSFWSMIDYSCTNGVWHYAKYRQFPLVLLLDGVETLVPQHATTAADKTLGVFHCPAGGHVEHLQHLRRRTFEWLAQMKNGRLPPALIWKSYRIQLWARLKYALGTLTNSLGDTEGILNDVDFQLLPLLNVNRHIRTGWRKLHQSFGGIGLLHLPTEKLICRLNILQQHYGTQSIVGQKLSCSLHWLQLQLGHNDNPLLLDYSQWNHLTCRSWWVELWQSLHNTPVTLRLKYRRQLPPRKFDATIMTFLMNHDLPMSTLAGMNRCRNFLNALFLSDITTADGKFIHQQFLSRDNPQPLDLSLSFPREQPTRSDWLLWISTWKQVTSTSFKLRSELGPWTHPSTIKWRWFHDITSDCLYQHAGDVTHFYSCSSTSYTRSGNKYKYSHSSHATTIGVPINIAASANTNEETSFTIVSRSPNFLSQPTDKSTTFWNTLISGGDDWMWQKFHFANNEDTSVDWIVFGLSNGTLMWVTDGSHYSQRGPYVSGAAWVVADRNSDKTMACSFAEFSPAASSYRAEALGLYSIHAFIHAISEHYNLQSGFPEIYCDNDAALKEAQKRRKRIVTSAACADIFRGIRKMATQLSSFQWSYTWVKAHMDDVLDWQELTRPQQLNVMCDSLAKQVAEEAIANSGYGMKDIPTQVLPHENVAIFVSSIKQTSDPAGQIRYSCGKHAAKVFLTSEMGWSQHQFEDVDWEHLHSCLQSKPDGFRTWLSKQHSNFCTTRTQTQRWFGSDDNMCPSCLEIEERADHLCRCQDPARRNLLATNTDDLIRWMSTSDNTHPDIIRWVEGYILGQGRNYLRTDHCPHSIRELVASQTRIGWRNFMEGRISTHFHRLQFCHLIYAKTNMTASSWVKTFISKLLHITHSQWIFRNFMLHERTHGLLRMKEQQAILLQIEALSLSDKNDLPEDSQFLLEFDIRRLHQADYETQCYWVAAVVAARTAIYGPEQPTNTPTQQPLLRRRKQIPQLGAPLCRTHAPIEIPPTRSRPSPSARFALEASNIAKKPD